MTDFFENPNSTVKRLGGVNIRPSTCTASNSKTLSIAQTKTLQENLKDLKQEIVKLEKNIKAPFNKKAFQIHANKSQAKGIIHRFPASPAYGITKYGNGIEEINVQVEECTTPTQRNKQPAFIKSTNRDVDNAIYTLIDAKDNFVREKQKEIHEANEEFRKLMVEAEKIKRDENQQKLRKIDSHHKNYEKRLDEARKQYEMQLNMLQQQLKDNIEGEESSTRSNVKTKVALLEKNSVFGKADSAYYAKLTPSKIDKLYASSANTPYKLDKDDYVQMKQNLKNSYGIVKHSQIGFENSQSVSHLKQNSYINYPKSYTSPNVAICTSDSESRYKLNNLFDQTKSTRNEHNEDFIDDIFFTKSPSYAQSKLERLKADIHSLQKSNQKRFPQNSDSKNKSSKRDHRSANYSPISKEFLMKSRKKKCKDDIELSSSSEDEKKFIKDYKKYKESVVLKEKVRQKQNQEFWENTQKK